MPNYNMNNTNFRRKSQFSSKLRCSFYTRDGRCNRNAARHSIYCWIHHERVMQSSAQNQNDIEKLASNESEKVILLTEPIETIDAIHAETATVQDQSNEIDIENQPINTHQDTTSLPEPTLNTEPIIEEAKVPVEEKTLACTIS